MTIRVPAIERRSEDQIRKWLQSDHVTPASKKNHSHHLGHYVTVARETGAGGSEVARKVADRLAWDLLDQEIVDCLEQQYGTPRCLIQRVDEKHENWLSEILTSRLSGLGFSEVTYTHRVAKLLLYAASHGNVVVVGRGARFILPKDQGMSVRIVASLDFRVKNIMDDQGLEEKEARRLVLETDHQRDLYIKEHFRQNAADPHHYDLVLNMDEITWDDAADIIVDSMQHRLARVA